MRSTEEGVSVPLYRLVEEGTGAVYVEAHDIRGFFVAPDESVPAEVLFRAAVRGRAGRGDELADAELQVINVAGAVIGSYYIGHVQLKSESVPGNAGEIAQISASFGGYAFPYPAAGEIWRRWASGIPVQRAEWAALPAGAHGSWLHVAATAWFETGRKAMRYGADEVGVINSSHLRNESSFYCELGEAINGPGGYFGATLDGLVDCLISSQRPGAPIRLVWQDFITAQERLGGKIIDPLVETLREFNVDLLLR
ncbi:barstar family protein [Kribbella deserti]|uniref:Barstar family protein n=1 Tax=Kribbella deserti TaxID=1926257 RepID=A0ABV6QHC0_9ACTN